MYRCFNYCQINIQNSPCWVKSIFFTLRNTGKNSFPKFLSNFQSHQLFIKMYFNPYFCQYLVTLIFKNFDILKTPEIHCCFNLRFPDHWCVKLLCIALLWGAYLHVRMVSFWYMYSMSFVFYCFSHRILVIF